MSSSQPKYDSLEYATELEAAGVPEAQAKIQAKALFRVIDQQLVTKQDIKELETKFGYDMKELEVRLEVKIKELEVNIQEVRRDIKELDVRLTLEMKGMENRIIIKLG